MVIRDFGGTEVFEQREVPKPVPKPTQVLVKVLATSINPLDYQTRRGDYKADVQLPAILGSDVSGVVEAVGDAVADLKIGDEVYYTPQIFGGDGSYAEYHVADESIVAHKPRNISHFEAASLSLTGAGRRSLCAASCEWANRYLFMPGRVALAQLPSNLQRLSALTSSRLAASRTQGSLGAWERITSLTIGQRITWRS
jgi:hypothetical protein